MSMGMSGLVFLHGSTLYISFCCWLGLYFGVLQCRLLNIFVLVDDDCGMSAAYFVLRWCVKSWLGLYFGVVQQAAKYICFGS